MTQNGAASTTSGTPPVIQVTGDNPVIIHVGDSYADRSATITGPQGDLNFGIKTFLNGILVSNIVLDTSSVATDTIDYVATDSAGVTATSTRTVITMAVPPATSPSGVDTASSIEATSRLHGHPATLPKSVTCRTPGRRFKRPAAAAFEKSCRSC